DAMGALDGAQGRTRVNLRAWGSRALHSPWGWIALGAILRLVHILTLGNRYYFGDTVEDEASAVPMLPGIRLDQAAPRAPLYPALMALSFWIGGESHYFMTRVFQLMLGVALMVAAARLAGRFGGRPAMVLAAVGMAFSPTIAFVAGLLYPTTLYMLLL